MCLEVMIELCTVEVWRTFKKPISTKDELAEDLDLAIGNRDLNELIGGFE